MQKSEIRLAGVARTARSRTAPGAGAGACGVATRDVPVRPKHSGAPRRPDARDSAAGTALSRTSPSSCQFVAITIVDLSSSGRASSSEILWADGHSRSRLAPRIRRSGRPLDRAVETSGKDWKQPVPSNDTAGSPRADSRRSDRTARRHNTFSPSRCLSADAARRNRPTQVIALFGDASVLGIAGPRDMRRPILRTARPGTLSTARRLPAAILCDSTRDRCGGACSGARG